MSDYISSEVVVQILTWLPPKSLLRFRCVSKSWSSLITTPDFITIHTHHLPLLSTTTRTLSRHYSKTHNKELYSVHYDNESFDVDENLKIEFPFHIESRFYFRIVGSCNGLLCLSDDLFGYTQNLILWNPAIRQKLTVPCPLATSELVGSYMFALGFGFDKKTKDYKIVRVAYVQGDYEFIVPPEVQVYAVKAGAWRVITAPPPFYCIIEYFWSQAFINGAVHWVAYHRSGGRGSPVRCLITLFDMGGEEFREIMLPECLARESPMNMSTAVLGESLSVFQYDRCMSGRCSSIWVMKEYSVAETWTKHFNCNLEGGLGMPLGLRKNGEILFAARSGELVSYNLGTRQTMNLGIFGTKDSFYVDTYRESLALLIEGEKIWERHESDSESDSSGEEGGGEDDRVEKNEFWFQSSMIQFLTVLLSEH